MVTRIFVGWQQPFAIAAAEHLLPHAKSFPSTLIITPTNQAGRQLLKQLAIRQGAILSPQLSTPGRLLETPDPDIASPWVERIAWQLTFENQTTWAPALFPIPPADSNDWSNMASSMVQLRRKLQENGLTISHAARRLASTVDADRWQALAHLESQMEQQLRAWSMRSRSRILAGGIQLPENLTSIILAGVTELPPLLARALESWNGQVVSLIAAPPEHEGDFSPLGIPLDRWNALPIPWPQHGKVHLCADIRQQSQRAIDCLIDADTSPEDAAIGCSDLDSASSLQSMLNELGWITHHPAATRAPSGIARWLKSWSNWLKDAKLSTAMDLLALPETQSLIAHDRAAIAEQLSRLRKDRMLLQLDDLRLCIQQNAFRNDTDRQNSIQALQTIESLDQWRARCLRKDFIDPLLHLLNRLSGHSDASTIEADTLAQWIQQAANIIVATQRPATFWIDLMLDDQSTPPYPVPDGRLVDIHGWLELLFCPGKHLILCNLNEGVIPSAPNTDPWLGEAATSLLGLTSDPQRATRDAFLLRSLIESRQSTGRSDLLCTKTKANGETLLPSRLLLASNTEDLPHRVQLLFADVEPPDARLRWQTEWKWSIPTANIPDHFNATALRDYLACPFRFYLKHMLRMHQAEPNRVEWNAREFGNAAHAILERWGKDPDARDLDQIRPLQAWLDHALDDLLHQQFGRRLPMAVRIQSESLRQRLRWFAEEQAVIRQQGWQVMHTELPFDIHIGLSHVRGVIDRIDHHPHNGTWRVIDYKTGKEPGTAAAHQSRITSKTCLPPHINENDPVIYSQTEEQKTISVRWLNLQLPLYAIAFQREFQNTATPCYFTLGETASHVKLDPWEDFKPTDQSAAEQCAEWIIERIHQGHFSPPAESVKHDDFEPLYAGRSLHEVFHSLDHTPT